MHCGSPDDSQCGGHENHKELQGGRTGWLSHDSTHEVCLATGEVGEGVRGQRSGLGAYEAEAEAN